MTGTIGVVFGKLAANRTAWRRARNLRAGARRTAWRIDAQAGTHLLRMAARWSWGVALVLVVVAGAAVIATHARLLTATLRPDGGPASVMALQPALPGVSFSVPAQQGVSLAAAGQGALLVVSGMRAAQPVRVDLCAQLADPAGSRLLPLHVGYRFADVAGWVERGRSAGRAIALRNVALAAPGSDMPRVDIDGTLASPGGLALHWDGRAGAVRWIGDASGGRIGAAVRGDAALGRETWLVWNDGALRIARESDPGCARAGALVLELYRPAAGQGRALVEAFPPRGAPLAAWLAPGEYRVPPAPAPALEDEALFTQLQAQGLVRVDRSGLIELAPPDLAAYRAAPPAARAARLAGWDGAASGPAVDKLLERLYRHADGDYVRAQVRVFNSERRLLAWRTAPGDAPGAWQASVDGATAATGEAMPPATARLFAAVPQGWGPWSRIADWPASGSGARITLALARPAAGGEPLRMLVAGRVTRVTGAVLRHPVADGCSGRACPSPGAVQQLDLALVAGVRSVSLDAAPIDLAGAAPAGDLRYRHLRLADGHIEWHAVTPTAHAPRAAAAVVEIADRNGTSLWRGGSPAPAAARAGLGTLLGLRDGQPNGVAGMLGRLQGPAGTAHRARLSIDLALQAASQAALECIGMRHGRLDGDACVGGGAVPDDREAGVVVLDAETGDVLAAAGAHAARPDTADWDELLAFDRADPARSLLRLPAFQHDGGGNSSPGSTFKIVSALGLELAARRDGRLDALLGGLPLAAINRAAADGGFGFRTGAPAYPEGTRRAHITNFRGETLDPLARDGRLGLAQALTYSLNTWFAWTGELSDRSLFGRPDGGAPDLQPLEPDALDGVRPIVAMAHRLGFGQPLRLDGGLLPADYPWQPWDALQGTPAHIDPIHSRHELRQMTIGLRMQATPLQMALVAGAVGQGRTLTPRLLLALDDRAAAPSAGVPLGVRLDRIRAGMKGVVDRGTAAGAFRGHEFDALRAGLYGKTGTAPTGERDALGHDLSTAWFACWLEPGSIPGQTHRLALAAYVSRSETTGGEHAAPIVAAVLRALQAAKPEQKGI